MSDCLVNAADYRKHWQTSYSVRVEDKRSKGVVVVENLADLWIVIQEALKLSDKCIVSKHFPISK